MTDIAIRVENLSKKFHIGAAQSKNLREALKDSLKKPFRRAGQLLHLKTAWEAELDETIWALKDVSFEVRRGEVIGIIGSNGAGKSTLLKIISHITEPTDGFAEIRGRVGSLLEVGTGFHPELTGRENIYLNGAILGMKKSEIKGKFDEIVAFSEVERFINTPVKHYSSGMYLRLAFAVAAHLEPEILIIDEVLAVGDAAFQKKCLGKMQNVAGEGRTILFVSHNMSAIQSLCSSVQLFEGGQLVLQDEPDRVVAHYLQKNLSKMNSIPLDERIDRRGSGAMRFTGVRFYDMERNEIGVGQTGKHLVIGLQYERKEQANIPAIIRIAFKNISGQRLFMCLSRASCKSSLGLNQRGEIMCHIPQLSLLEGRYIGSIWCKINEIIADELEDAFVFDVMNGDFFETGKVNPTDFGDMVVNHYWEVR